MTVTTTTNVTRIPAEQIRPCDRCAAPLSGDGIQAGIRLTVERLFIDRIAAQQLFGLQQFFGGGNAAAGLAAVMAPVTSVVMRLDDATEKRFLCSDCMASVLILLEETDPGRRAEGGAP